MKKKEKEKSEFGGGRLNLYCFQRVVIWTNSEFHHNRSHLTDIHSEGVKVRNCGNIEYDRVNRYGTAVTVDPETGDSILPDHV